MAQYVICPECGTKNPVVADGPSKIDCSSCGMLLVLKKLDIQDEASAAPKKPALKSRKARAVEAAAAAEAEAEAATEPAGRRGRRASKTSSRRPTRGGGRRRVAPVEEEPPQQTRVGGRAMRKSNNNVPPAVMWSSLAALVCIVGAVIFFVMKNGDDEAVKDANAKDQTQASADASDESAEDSDEVASDAGTEASEEKTAAVSEEKKAEPAKAAKKPAKKKKSGKWEFTKFEKPTDVSDEDFGKTSDLIATMTDPNETRKAGIAQRTLVQMPRAAIPALINALHDLNPEVQEDVYKGQQIITALEIGSRGATDFWENGSWSVPAWVADTGSREAADSFRTRRQCVKQWAKWWEKNGADWKPKVESEDDW